jgi:hypothetical protein
VIITEWSLKFTLDLKEYTLWEKKDMNTPIFEFCSNSDPRYKTIRDRHYIPNKGSHGQQIHFLIHYNDQIIGIISGGSSVYAVKWMDEYFKITKDQKIKQQLYLSAIVNNTVFRLEYHEKNLGTKILAKWRKVICQIWQELYGVEVIGFETFVIENDTRKGTIYKADNWNLVGVTAGNTKLHGKGGLTESFKRTVVEKKLCFCKLIKKEPPTIPYISSWKSSTPEEKARAKLLVAQRKKLLGVKF